MLLHYVFLDYENLLIQLLFAGEAGISSPMAPPRTRTNAYSSKKFLNIKFELLYNLGIGQK